MVLPYKISTLLFIFNEADEILLIRRAQEPNLGLWSPPGGKLKMHSGESPYSCACREAQEETALHLKPTDLHLNGLVSEHGYEGQAHWLMFLRTSRFQPGLLLQGPELKLGFCMLHILSEI